MRLATCVAPGRGDPRVCWATLSDVTERKQAEDRERLAREVLERSRTTPVLVDFWAPWCGPCRAYSPVFEEVAKQFAGKVKFVKVNVDDEPELAEKFNVQSIPTTLLIRSGSEVERKTGVQNADALKAWAGKA